MKSISVSHYQMAETRWFIGSSVMTPASIIFSYLTLSAYPVIRVFLEMFEPFLKELDVFILIVDVLQPRALVLDSQNGANFSSRVKSMFRPTAT